MKPLKKISSLLAILPMLLFAQAAYGQAADAKVVEITGTDQMRFTVTEITARPGQTVTVKLTTKSDFPKTAMAHNFVLLKAKADAMAVASASAKASDNEYIAPEMTDQMIAHTKLAGGGETVEVTFKAPSKPGEYQYICTFPGHYASGMKGTLTVSEN